MNRPTLSDFRKRLPSALGTCASNVAGAAALANDAMERLMMDPLTPDEGWVGGSAVMRFMATVNNKVAYITTPRNVSRIILLDVCQNPIRLRNGFYEFLQYGKGLQPKTPGTCGCSETRQAFERDNVATLTPLLSTPQIIRVFPSDAADVGQRVLIQGSDQNGKTVTSLDPVTQQSILGEYVDLALPFSDSINQFSKITGIQKDVTIDTISLFQVDPTTGTQVDLSSMEADETAGWYRLYLLNNMPVRCHNTSCGTIQVDCQVRLDFEPVNRDSDYLFIPNIPALIEEAQSIRYSRLDSKTSAQFEQKHHARAIQLLNGQLDQINGKVTTVVSAHVFGSDRVKASFA